MPLLQRFQQVCSKPLVYPALQLPGKALLLLCVLLLTIMPLPGRGIATISGISIHRQGCEADASSESGNLLEGGLAQPHQLLLWPECGECQQPLMQPALEVAQPQQQLELPLLVQPSNKPARLYITHHGKVICAWDRPSQTFFSAYQSTVAAHLQLPAHCIVHRQGSWHAITKDARICSAAEHVPWY